MANHTITESNITINSRGSLSIPLEYFDESGVQQDISDWTVYFEVDGCGIRELCVVNPDDALGLIVVIERSQVETLSTTDSPFNFVDETSGAESARVLWSGNIRREGYKGAPDSVIG